MQIHFQKLRTNLELNDTFKNIVQVRHAAVRSVIGNNLPSITDTKLIGSLQRQTRIQPRPNDEFDIDILVILGDFSNWAYDGRGISAGQALQTIYGSAQQSDRYSTKNPQQDAPAVSLDFADRIKVELVPAYIDNVGIGPSGEPVASKGRGYWIPKNGRWEHADYDFEADYISQLNTASDGWLVPTIKMLKAIRREYFPALRSFPMEILAAQVIPTVVGVRKSRGQQISWPILLEDFFGIAKSTLGTPLKIPASNSPAVTLDPVSIQTIQHAFGVIERHIQVVNQATTDTAGVEGWRQLFGDAFPTRI